MYEKPAYEELENRIQQLEQVESNYQKTQQALRESEKRYRAVVEDMPGLICSFLPGGEIIFVNKAYCSYFGSTFEQLVGTNFLDLIPQSEQKAVMDNISSLTFESPTQSHEHKVILPNGQIRWQRWTNRALFNDLRNTVGYQSIGMDIKEHKLAEEALRHERNKAQKLLDVAGVMFVAIDANGEVTLVNQKGSMVLGYDQKDIIGRNWFDNFLPMRVRNQTKAVFNRLMAGEIEPIEYFENPVLTNSGEERIVAWHNTILKDDEGIINGTLSSGEDITERKQTEEALRTSHNTFLTVLDGIDAAIYVADMETYEILFMNKYMIESFGNDLTGKTCWEVFRDETEPCSHCTNDQLLDINGKPADVCVWQGENPITQKWYINYDRAIEWTDGRLVRLQISTDITDLKKMEEELRQARKMESIGTLAGGIAHDFNNILGIILGNIELAIDDVPDWNPARMNLEEVRTASLRAKDVVRQLLSFARETRLEKKPTNIIPIVKESLKLLRSSISTSIEIRQYIPDRVDAILADPTQINQVLINLCTNADHAMPTGGILNVALKNVALEEAAKAKLFGVNPGRYVNLTVSDTGHGISAEEIDRIFDPYFTTKDVGKGTGMGLAVVHGILKEHNGTINVKSEIGEGTTFSIYFPAVEQEAIVEPVTDEQLPSGIERILFVDDEESIANLGRQRLERLGYTVEATTNPIEALDLFHSNPDQYDLIITDLAMPKMTGDKLVEEILSIRQDVPIILCTGFSEKIDEKKAKAIGAADYIEKPLDKRDFAFKVRKVLDRSS